MEEVNLEEREFGKRGSRVHASQRIRLVLEIMAEARRVNIQQAAGDLSTSRNRQEARDRTGHDHRTVQVQVD